MYSYCRRFMSLEWLRDMLFSRMRKMVFALLIFAALSLLAQQTALLSLLKSTVAIGKQADGSYLVTSNQLLRPWGEQTVIPGRPVDMAFDSRHRLLAVLNTRSLLLLD